MEKNESKRAYMFYASDYHFEMIGLLNISKEIKENKKVIILTQNNLQNSVETVLSRINLKEDEKEKIKQINWTDEEKGTELKTAILNATGDGVKKQELSIYIKGTEKFIEQQNQKIENLIKANNRNINESNKNMKIDKSSYTSYNNISITDCYNFIEIAEKSKEIVKKYKNNLNTEGKKCKNTLHN